MKIAKSHFPTLICLQELAPESVYNQFLLSRPRKSMGKHSFSIFYFSYTATELAQKFIFHRISSEKVFFCCERQRKMVGCRWPCARSVRQHENIYEIETNFRVEIAYKRMRDECSVCSAQHPRVENGIVSVVWACD